MSTTSSSREATNTKETGQVVRRLRARVEIIYTSTSLDESRDVEDLIWEGVNDAFARAATHGMVYDNMVGVDVTEHTTLKPKRVKEKR